MEAQMLVKKIEEEISAGRTGEALNTLKTLAKSHDQEVQYQVLSLITSWNLLTKERQAGIISSEEAHRRQNKIHYDLLHIVRQLHEPNAERSSWIRRYTPFLIGGLWLIAGLILVFLWRSIAQTVDLKIETLSDRLEFSTLESGSFFAGQHVVSAQLQNYDQVRIPADTVAIDWDLDGNLDEQVPVQSELRLQPEIDGSLLLSDVRLASLDFPAGTKLALEATGTNRFNFNLVNPEPMEANFYLSDQLRFETVENRIEGWDKAYYGDPIRGWINYSGIPPNLNVQASDLFQLFLQLQDSVSINEKRIKISSVDWNKIDRKTQDRRPESTIRQGKLTLSNAENNPFLEGEQFLRIRPTDQFFLQSFSVEPGGIRARFLGEVTAVETGIDLDLLVSRMPTRLEKAWETKRAFFVLALVALVSITFLLLYLKRQNAILHEKDIAVH